MRPYSLDSTASTLERYVRPRFLDCRKEFYRAYCQVHDDWAADPIHATNVFDSAKCDRFIALSLHRLENIVSKYEKRFLFDCVRTFPLSALKYVCDDVFENTTTDLVRVLSAAILATDSATDPVRSGGSISLALPERTWSDRLVADLGAMFGYALAIAHGQQSYRFASKGGKIERPAVSTTPLDTIFRKFSNTSLFVASGIRFADDPELTFCVQQYDNRRLQDGLGVSGFPAPGAPIDVPAAGQRIWWALGIVPSELSLSIQINLGGPPNNRMVIETRSYMAFPVNADAQYQVLDAFPEQCKTRLGFDPKTLGDLCDALAMTLLHEACYDRFLPIVGKKGLVYDCDLSSDARRKIAPRIIHAIGGKAVVEFVESHLVEKLSKTLLGRGYHLKNGRAFASEFVKRFCGVPKIAHSLEPILFVPLTGKRLGLDLLLMQEYHELCRRIVLFGDGTTGQKKAAIFEKLARSFIIRELNVSNNDIPVEPNTKMRKLVPGPVDYGDVDFAFMIGTTLVHLDMKSSCRRPDEFRGDYHAITKRAGHLRQMMLEHVEPRGRHLAEYLRGMGVKVEAVLNFLCVGVAEYIPPGFPELRYGEIPRAVTPRELVSIIRDGIAVGAST